MRMYIPLIFLYSCVVYHMLIFVIFSLCISYS